MICAHCKTESAQLELIQHNGSAFYGCDRCQNFFNALHKTLDENWELLERLSD